MFQWKLKHSVIDRIRSIPRGSGKANGMRGLSPSRLDRRNTQADSATVADAEGGRPPNPYLFNYTVIATIAYLHCTAQHPDSCRRTHRPCRRRRAALKFYLLLVNFRDVLNMVYQMNAVDAFAVASVVRWHAISAPLLPRLQWRRTQSQFRWKYRLSAPVWIPTVQRHLWIRKQRAIKCVLALGGKFRWRKTSEKWPHNDSVCNRQTIGSSVL